MSAPRRLPVRVTFGPWNGTPLPLLSDADLELLAALVCRGLLRQALLEELALREGSDRSGPRKQRAA